MNRDILTYADRRDLGIKWVDTYRASLQEGFTEAEAIEDISVLSGYSMVTVTGALRTALHGA